MEDPRKGSTDRTTGGPGLERHSVLGRKTTTIGFDFGTSTTLVATEDDVLGLGTDRARRWMPSLVGHTDSGEIVAGDRADTPAVKTVRSIKRMITANQKFLPV